MASRFKVSYHPAAAHELALLVGARGDVRAVVNVVEKLTELGPRLGPPHAAQLKGASAAGLFELRPRRGNSDWRLICCRAGHGFVVLAVTRHAGFAKAVLAASQRLIETESDT